jgi:hypothetical protein
VLRGVISDSSLGFLPQCGLRGGPAELVSEVLDPSYANDALVDVGTARPRSLSEEPCETMSQRVALAGADPLGL